MEKSWILLGLVVLLVATTSLAYSEKTSLATFQETAQVIIDKSISQNVTAAITLQSTSIQEIRIPAELEQKIRDNPRIISIVVTNQNQCVLGVSDESCIIINVARDTADKNYLAIQNSTKRIADLFIAELNSALDTDAKYNSVFIQTSDSMSAALNTPGIISGKGTVSAVYTMTMEDTQSMYEKISAILIPAVIRNSGGFYDTAKNLSKEENSKVTFSIIPMKTKSLLQLRLSTDYPHTALAVSQVEPLKFLKTDELKRSSYFSSGFYPLNSVLQVVVLSPEPISITNVKGNIIPTQIIDGEKIPTEITKQGWIFDPEEGKRIQGKYIFGEKTSVGNNELTFSLVGNGITTPKKIEIGFDESTIVIAIISVVSVGVAIFYLKGYRK